MEIHILSRDNAEKRKPKKIELLIGVLDSRPYGNFPSDKPVAIEPNNLRINYLTYRFDDIQEEYKDYILINSKTSKKIIEDFLCVKNKTKSLAIHCNAGMSRSPAIGKALNDIFNLKCDNVLSEYYNSLNLYVYSMMILSAAENNIGKGKEILNSW